MYIPDSMQMNNQADVYQFIQEFSFATIISQPLEATHLPFVLKQNQGEKGALYCHFAKANPHWQKLEGQAVLIIFNGPHAYISPTWYATKPAVPTWNYAAVHVYGVVETLNSEETLELITDSIIQYQPELLKDQNIISDEHRGRLLKAIVGCKINIKQIEGKNKLGQHRSFADQLGVVNGLQLSDKPETKALLNYMLAKGIGIGIGEDK